MVLGVVCTRRENGFKSLFVIRCLDIWNDPEAELTRCDLTIQFSIALSDMGGAIKIVIFQEIMHFW
jgi:hypothetical protein